MPRMRKTKLAEKSSYKRRVRQIKAPHYRQVRRRRGAFLYFDIDCNARLEFHCEVILIDSKFLDVPFDQCLIKLCDVGSLTGDEFLQLFDPLYLLISCSSVDGGLLAEFLKPEYFISNFVIGFFAICFLNKILE